VGNKIKFLEFEVSTAVRVRRLVFWVVTPCKIPACWRNAASISRAEDQPTPS
jgi:hypothetical protein